MKTFKTFLEEGYMLQLIRDKNVDVLKIKDSREKSWVEIRGKKNYEVDGYDKNDQLHQVLDKIGKAANISDLMNGTVVSINPNHPDGKKAIDLVKKIMTEEVKSQYSSLKGDIKTISMADSPDILKDIMDSDEYYAAEVLMDVLELDDPPSTKRTQSIRKKLQQISQKQIEDSEVTVYRIGSISGNKPLSFTLINNRDRIASGLPWTKRMKDTNMYTYKVKKKDILVIPNAILRPGKGTDNEMEVIIMPNKVKKIMP